MVRLKSQLYDKQNRFNAFQFHYGSIKMFLSIPAVWASTSFQFHYGSIKILFRRLSRQTKRCFNSTMVRLKYSPLFIIELNLLSFNSTMVRLKWDKKILESIKTMFQFHYGSIKILPAVNVGVGVELFQFHYGSIKIIIVESRPDKIICFNSTMVRLKSSPRVATSMGIVFQFHYGSIKIPRWIGGGRGEGVFQFHYGSIKIWGCYNEATRKYKVSIPLWFD